MAEKIPKDKDELIVRQSQMDRAIQLFHLLELKPSVKEVCRLSQILTEFIFTWDIDNADLNNFNNHVNKINSQKKQNN